MPHRRVRAHYQQLSEFERGRIIGLKERRWANRRIRHDGSGQPRATADQEDNLIVRSAVTALDASLSTIRRTTLSRVSTMTIPKRLIERNLPSYQTRRHLPITPAHCQTRLQWCLARSGWNHADWGRIVFSDESHFQLCPDDQGRCVWRRPGQRADSAFNTACHTGPQELWSSHGRTPDWYQIFGSTLVQNIATDFAQLKAALSKAFPAIQNRKDLETRFYASQQRQNQEPTYFVYDLLKLHKKLELGMFEKALVDHIFVRLKPQVQDYVEVRNPQTAIQLLEVLAKFEERYSCKATLGSRNSNIVEKPGCTVSYYILSNKWSEEFLQ
ncbi:HTH_Tnp_Tc3_2 domain-containing protein [Trichonephila clavipes]|nr:HTH_Tnp_Tc3_2 domain-containing protein [Trichonephila clavipes]